MSKNMEFDFGRDEDEELEGALALMEQLKGETSPICLSGAARGSDTIWGRTIVKAGGEAIHFSFEDHRRSTRDSDGEIFELDDDELSVAVPALRRTAKRIGRAVSPPFSAVGKLLRRNWWQVCRAVEVRAVAPLIGGEVQGGTAWAIDMARHEFGIPVHLFCAMDEKWLTAAPGQDWKDSEFPSYVPNGPWAGIGMRDLEAAGYAAITSHEALFRNHFTLVSSNPQETLPSP